MSNEYKTIYEFDFNLICEYFASVERQGPGSPEMTRLALSFIDNLGGNSKIADIGCGTGGQTLTLAENTAGTITGIDLFPEFIDIFNRNMAGAGFSDRVKGIVGSMDDLKFVDGELDLIWSEGAIYNIGFQRGLHEWRRFIKPGGFIAVSEASWFTAQRPAEIEKFWMDSYPEIDTIPAKVAQMQDAGYVPVAAFIIPEECWTKHFYDTQPVAREEFLKKYPGNVTAEELVSSQRHEEGLYRKYKDFYGYVFYIGKKFGE